jgi:hypothetical protein
MKGIAACGFLAIAAAACTTVWFVGALKPASATAFAAFSAWLVSPYAAMAAALLFLERRGAAPVHWPVVAIVVSAGGVLFLADVIFWHTDAQGAIAVLMAPLLQSIALAVLLPLSGWAFRRAQN